MSFIDDVDLEAQVPYSDSPEFDRLGEAIATGLFDINSNIVNLQRLLKALDSNKDTSHDTATEERAVEVADQTRQKFKALSESMKRLQTWADCQPAQRFTQQKLSREFNNALGEFQDIQRDLAQKQRSSIIRAKTNLAALHPDDMDERPSEDVNAAERQHILAQEELDQAEVDYQQQLISEREEEIQGIEHGIQELNEIFTDLSTIVTEQGTIIG
jgi:hypothetical protein